MERAVNTDIAGYSCPPGANCTAPAPAGEQPEYQLGAGYVVLGELGMASGAIGLGGAIGAQYLARAFEAKRRT